MAYHEVAPLHSPSLTHITIASSLPSTIAIKNNRTPCIKRKPHLTETVGKNKDLSKEKGNKKYIVSLKRSIKYNYPYEKITCKNTCVSHVIHMWNCNNHMWVTCGTSTTHVVRCELHGKHMWLHVNHMLSHVNHMWSHVIVITCVFFIRLYIIVSPKLV